MLRDNRFLVNVQRLQQRRDKASARSETCARRNVGHTRDFERARLLLDHSQRFPNKWMLYFFELADPFHMRILDDEIFLKRVMERAVHIFVNRGGQHKSAVFLIVRRQVGSTARSEERR